MSLTQAQVYADGMYLLVAWHLQAAVQQPALLVPLNRNVKVFVVSDREFRQQRIAVIPVGINSVTAIGELRPHAVSEKLVLWGLGPVWMALGVLLVTTVNLLEKHQVRVGGAHGLAQLGQDESAVELGEALVDIDRQHIQTVHGGIAIQSRAG
jgi:hypothetical protein